MNTAETRDGQIYRYVPLIDRQGRLVGMLVLSYQISFLKANDSPLAAAVLVLAMATPFITLGFFTYWFGRRLEKRISPAMASLMEGATRVERADLDFTLGEVGGTRELAALGNAFEKMRQSLRTSLESQWRAEQGRREMLAALAHDLFTPLTIILGHAENLLNRESRRDEHRYRPARAIHANAERAIRILEEMQEANRLERADFSLSPAPLDIRAYLEEKKGRVPFPMPAEGHPIAFQPGGSPQPSRTDAGGRTAPVANPGQRGRQRPSVHPVPGRNSLARAPG